MKILFGILAIVAVLVVVSLKFSRFGYESASYTVVEKDGPFEIRQYPELTLVSTASDSSDPEGDGAFMRLFRYIAKDNADEQKIAMTTPVFMTSGDNASMSFVVPEEVAKSGAPAPKSSNVKLTSRSPGKVAAYRYSGSWQEKKRAEARKTLTSWITEKGYTSSGDFYSAGYDPPFTPGFLRRNEVLVRLSD